MPIFPKFNVTQENAVTFQILIFPAVIFLDFSHINTKEIINQFKWTQIFYPPINRMKIQNIIHQVRTPLHPN